MLYFDNSATTKINEEALEVYNHASQTFFNPSSLYGLAGEEKSKIETARANMIKYFKGAQGSTLIYTGSATEANNAVLHANITRKDKKYLIGAGEHSSIYEVAKSYLEQGFNIQFVPIKQNGGVDEEALMSMLDRSVAFVSIIHVSNETGAVNDVKTITKKIKTFNPSIVVHSDGVQAVGKLDINLEDFNLDYYTISAHKIHGPKGIGGLYIKNPNKFKPFILGGGQEMNLRSGTENVPAILAFECAVKNLHKTNFALHKQVFLKEITEEHLLISDSSCVDNIISICFFGVLGETLVHMLEEKGFLIGTGSACNSKAKANRVLEQIVPKKFIEGAVRISFDASITVFDCENLGKALNDAVKLYKRKLK